jgi:hypothetical protein
MALVPALRAQLPFHEPLNPTSAIRTALYAQPYRAFDPRGGWQLRLGLAYGNAIESDTHGTSSYLLDAEALRVSFGASRDLGTRGFVALETGVTGTYAGFADGFFVWYHRVIGFRQPERTARPRNEFAWRFILPGVDVERTPVALALADTRMTVGIRHGESLQSAFSVTLPTATGGLGRGVPSVALVHTVHQEISSRLQFEGTFGTGATPRHGALAPWQRTLFASASTGVAIRLFGAQSVYGSFFWHSPYYRGTDLRSLDRHELTADFGWLARGADGREWHVGLTEDLGPGDPGIDLILSVGRTF